MAVSSNSYKNIIASLLRVAECPVCLETIKIPFKICSKGHGSCSRCTEKLKACPTCQGALILENPVSMKNLLEALPQHCRYADGGCEIIVQQGDDHEHVCGYRPILCRISKCEKTVPVVNLLDHYKSEHPSSFVCQEEVVDITVPDFKPRDSFWSYLPVSLFGNLFWILTINDPREGFEMFFSSNSYWKVGEQLLCSSKI